MANEVQMTKVVTGKVRFSYLHVFEPSAIEEGQEKKYSVSLIIPKSDKATIAKLTKAVEAAKEAGKMKLAGTGGKIPANLKTPLRDGDAEKPDDEAYAGSVFLNANCKTKPGVVDKNLNPVMSQDDVYSGCYGRASVTFYAFNTSGNKGIACGLNNIMKLEDGESLGGRSAAESDFAEFAEDDDML